MVAGKEDAFRRCSQRGLQVFYNRADAGVDGFGRGRMVSTVGSRRCGVYDAAHVRTWLDIGRRVNPQSGQGSGKP